MYPNPNQNAIYQNQYGQPPVNNGFNQQPATVIYSNEQEKFALPKQANHA
jgi:hypothetical protein